MGVWYLGSRVGNVKSCHTVPMPFDWSVAGSSSIFSSHFHFLGVNLLPVEVSRDWVRVRGVNGTNGVVIWLGSAVWSPTRVIVATDLLVPQPVDEDWPMTAGWPLSPALPLMSLGLVLVTVAASTGRSSCPTTLINDFIFSLLPSNPFTFKRFDFSVVIIFVIVMPNVFPVNLGWWFFSSCFTSCNGLSCSAVSV